MATVFLVLFVLYFLGSHISKFFEKIFPVFNFGNIQLDEDVDNYWAALDDDDRKWSIKEEENARQACGMQIMTDAQFEELTSATKTKGKTLQGVHSYDILANPLYLDDFQYVTAAEDDRDEMIIDDDIDEGNDAAQSDMVRICLNLAYLTEKEANGFTFNRKAVN